MAHPPALVLCKRGDFLFLLDVLQRLLRWYSCYEAGVVTSVRFHDSRHEDDLSLRLVLGWQPEQGHVALGVRVIVGDGAAADGVGALHLEEGADALLGAWIHSRDEEALERVAAQLNLDAVDVLVGKAVG